MQETHSTKNCEKIWRSEFKGNIFFEHGESNAKGVCTLISTKCEFTHAKTVRGKNGRELYVQGTIGSKTFTLANIYAPNRDDPQFLLKCLYEVQEANSDIKILGGDLNILLQPELDRRGGAELKQLSNTAKLTNEFLNEFNWSDVWRSFHEDAFQFTWYRRNPLVMSRLDYFLLPNDALIYISNCEIQPSILTDHSAVEITLMFNKEIKGRGFWKFNTSLLRDPDFVKDVNQAIEMAEFRYETYNPGLKLECVKMDFTELAMMYGRIRASERKIKKESLFKMKHTQEKKLACINLQSDKAIHMIDKVNSKINKINSELQKLLTLKFRERY